ncbi:hypothetical protein [Haloferax larsenii]|uniref:hypothetical protein n=1 Tax=Haloferax larsenii TaxID=302484 RepID=UPI001113B59D|nr:hypothetical protein [Haloferax larsenii]
MLPKTSNENRRPSKLATKLSGESITAIKITRSNTNGTARRIHLVRNGNEAEFSKKMDTRMGKSVFTSGDVTNPEMKAELTFLLSIAVHLRATV